MLTYYPSLARGVVARQRISARTWNDLRNQTAREITGGYVQQTAIGTSLAPAQGTDAVTIKLAKITAKAGTEAPYVYSALEVEYDDSGDFEPENFTEVSGGDDLGENLVNIEEIGPSAVGAMPLEVNDLVEYTPMGENWYKCKACNYKGTY